MNNKIQALPARRARMLGKEVLWLPGTDHAGIATQNVVEKRLRAEGKTKHDLGRDRFVGEVWKWKEKYGGIIIEQVKKTGSSCGCARLRVIIGSPFSRVVQEGFFELYFKRENYCCRRVGNSDPLHPTTPS